MAARFKFVQHDVPVEAWADLWFNGNPIFINVMGAPGLDWARSARRWT